MSIITTGLGGAALITQGLGDGGGEASGSVRRRRRQRSIMVYRKPLAKKDDLLNKYYNALKGEPLSITVDIPQRMVASVLEKYIKSEIEKMIMPEAV